MNKKINNYTITLVSIIVLVLVFGITLTQGSSEDRKRSDLEIADLKAQIISLEDRITLLEKSNRDKSKEISKLQKTLFDIQSEADTLVKSTNLFTAAIPKETKAMVIKPKISSLKPVPKKYYTSLEIAGFATYKVEYSSGQSALDQLTDASKEFNFSIKTTKYDFGVFVDCMGGICGDSNHFWALYKNGAMSMVGAADLILEINDKISWVYSAF